MTFADELLFHREDRLKALAASWTGPGAYDPYHYFSVFHPRFLLYHLQCRVFLIPFAAVNLLAVGWVILVQVLFACTAAPCTGFLAQLTSLSSFLTLFQVILALLLSFRLARCAVRFYDARAASGKLIEICRTMASEVAVYGSHDAALRDQCLRWIAAMPVATKNFLRGVPGQVEELDGILKHEEAEHLLAAPHQPLFVLDVLRTYSMRLATAHPAAPAVAAMVLEALTQSVNTLNGAMGAMERIGNTPLPVAYMIFIRAYIVVYLVLVVFLLGHSWGWYTIVIIVLMSWLLLGLECAATECERPMQSRLNHLALERYCVVVADNLQQIAATLATTAEGLQLPWERDPAGRSSPDPHDGEESRRLAPKPTTSTWAPPSLSILPNT
eukprot:EG_transcript_11696